MPVSFYFRQLILRERNYPIVELEALAVLASVEHFCFYLFGCLFTILLTTLHLLISGKDKNDGQSNCEEVVKSCHICQANHHSPAPAQLHPWEWPDPLWSRLHIDFAGPVKGSMLLIVVDSHSKWLEVHTMSSITSQTIEKLRSIFARHGLPKTIVSDNGPSFVSSEFKTFLQLNGIRNITSAPYHPSTNGLAERAVQTVKQGIKQMEVVSLEENCHDFSTNTESLLIPLQESHLQNYS